MPMRCRRLRRRECRRRRQNRSRRERTRRATVSALTRPVVATSGPYGLAGRDGHDTSSCRPIRCRIAAHPAGLGRDSPASRKLCLCFHLWAETELARDLSLHRRRPRPQVRPAAVPDDVIRAQAWSRACVRSPDDAVRPLRVLRRIRRLADLSQRELADRCRRSASRRSRQPRAGAARPARSRAARAAAARRRPPAGAARRGRRTRSPACPPTRCGTWAAGGSPRTWTPGYSDERWWHGRAPATTGAQPWYTFDRDREGRDACRRTGTAHRTTTSSRSRATPRRSGRAARRRRAPAARAEERAASAAPERRGARRPSAFTCTCPAGVRRARRLVAAGPSTPRNARVSATWPDPLLPWATCAAASCLPAAARPSPRSAPSPRDLPRVPGAC